MLQNWLAGHDVRPAGGLQQILSKHKLDLHCALDPHVAPSGCGVGVAVTVGVLVAVGVNVGAM